MNLLFLLVLLATGYNMTITMQPDQLTYCYWNGGERTPSCNYTDIDKDRFQLLDRFMQFLAQGDLKD